jgi:hypothetical protein
MMNQTLLSCIDSRVEGPMKFYGRFELALCARSGFNGGE